MPNNEIAEMPRGKINLYLLNLDHVDGRSKANFFIQVGYDENSLANTLLAHVREYDFVESENNEYGTKYTVDGIVECPLGFSFNLRSIWIIRLENAVPTLITAYPSKR
ncbi:MAG: DUF6883 domain-containing protein [Saprospiraceae bacterium]